MSRPFNFAPGPARLPPEVLEQAAAEMLDYQGSGMSVMEMSHRGKHYTRIQDEAMADFRSLLGVPSDYEVLFMQGGAIAENSIVPLNLSRGGKVDFVVTGSWSKKSAAEATKYCDAKVIASAEQNGHFTHIPAVDTWGSRTDAQYLHLCTNETIHGVEFHALPNTKTDIVADVSSHILSRRMDVSKYACLFGGAQKNVGISGLTFVVVRKDLLGHALLSCPGAFDYQTVAANGSMFNTPPTYAVYIAGLVFKWLKEQGGVAAIEARNIQKSQELYDFIDASHLYAARVSPDCRSRMNVTFDLRDSALNDRFVEGGASAGLLAFRGHKSAGGMRASIYNAMPIEGVRALIAYMREFERLA
jgi:phosphoserine aminotransferase